MKEQSKTMRRIYQLEYTEFTDNGSKAKGYLFLIADSDEEAVEIANNEAKEKDIFYIFGQSDIILNESIEELDNGVFEVIFAPN